MFSNQMSTEDMAENVNCNSFNNTSEHILKTNEIKVEIDMNYEYEENMESLEWKSELKDIQSGMSQFI